MLDKSRIDLKLGSFGIAPGAALSDKTLLPKVQTYRRQLGAKMIAFDKSVAAKKLPDGDFYISQKVDGEFNVLIYRDEGAILVNPGGTVRVGLPVLDEAADALKKAGVKTAMIPGELHVHREDGKRSRVHDVSRFARKPENQKQLESLKFAPFDVLEIDGKEWGDDYSVTWDRLSELFGTTSKVQPVETVKGDGAKAILEQFDIWVEKGGGEGVVARSDDNGWFKVKPRHTLDVCVIGFAEGTDERAGMLHDLLLGIYRCDGSVQVLGRVGGGFSDDQRRKFLSDLRDLVVESEYSEINSDRVAYEMVRPEWVIEISCLDLISTTTRGATIDRMVLEWGSDSDSNGKGIWKTARRLPLCSIISPQFQRIREDKEPGPEDCRFSQLTDIVEIEMADATSDDLQLPESELLRREVRVKELKGKQMVRKLLMWKTNKEVITRGEFPSYVIHLTDFSPNRKDPLKREIRVSDSREQIEILYQELHASTFVKGWNQPVGVANISETESDSEPSKKAVSKKGAGKKRSSKKKAASRKKSATKKKTK